MKPLDLLKRIPGVTTDLSRALDGKSTWYLWQGKIGSRPGRYWIPNLFGASKLPAAVKALAASDGISEFSAAGLVEKSHKGIGNAQIGLVPWAFAEMDAVARGEQDRRLAALSAATGLTWAMLVFSGGKSVHAYIAFLHALAPNDPLRMEIQKLLIVILEGDTKITDQNRLMRLPGYGGKDRPQPVLSISDARYEAQDIHGRLVSYAEKLGIADLATAYRALQVAEELEHEAARREEDDASDTDAAAMRATARVLRDTRATITAAEIVAATRPWKTTGGSGVAGAGGTIGSGSVSYMDEAAWIALTGTLSVGERCFPPCCVGYVRGTTGKYYGDSVRCLRCNKSYRPERALVSRDLPDGVEDVTTLGSAPPAVRALTAPPEREPTFLEVIEAERRTEKQAWVAGVIQSLEAGKAEREREAAETLREGLGGYAGRLAKKKAKAAEVPEGLRIGAEAALKLAGEILPRVRTRREDLGLPTERPAGSAPCGVSLALHHGVEGTALGARICRYEDCPVHGPVHQARRIAAAVKMPLVLKDDVGPPGLGTALGARTLHEYRFSTSKVESFRKAWGRTEFVPNSASHDLSKELRRNSGQTSPDAGYVAFDLGNGEIVALATHPARIGGTGKKGGRPSALSGSYVGEVRAEDVEERIVALGLESIRVAATVDEALEGLTPRRVRMIMNVWSRRAVTTMLASAMAIVFTIGGTGCGGPDTPGVYVKDGMDWKPLTAYDWDQTRVLFGASGGYSGTENLDPTNAPTIKAGQDLLVYQVPSLDPTRLKWGRNARKGKASGRWETTLGEAAVARKDGENSYLVSTEGLQPGTHGLIHANQGASSYRAWFFRVTDK